MDRPRRRFFFAWVALLGVGLVHGELTALLWGGAFGSLWVAIAVIRLAALQNLGAIEGALEVLPEGRVRFTTPHPPRVPVLFGWWLECEAVHSPERRVRALRPLAPEVTFDVAARGRYLVTVRWQLIDTLGFTTWTSVRCWEAVLIVPPKATPFVPPRPQASRRGRWSPRTTGAHPGDPFDVRPYQPGDDLRRLHWPLYAHSGLAFVRTADPSPPPAGHWFVVLDTVAPSEADLDHRLGALVTWLEGLDRQGAAWTLDIPGAQPPVRLPSGQEWRSTLAGLRPTLAAPPLGAAQGFFLTGRRPEERSTDLPGWAAGLVPVVVDTPTEGVVRRPWWER